MRSNNGRERKQIKPKAREPQEKVLVYESETLEVETIWANVDLTKVQDYVGELEQKVEDLTACLEDCQAALEKSRTSRWSVRLGL